MKTDGRNHPSSFQCGNYETENRKQTKIQCKYMQILISTCKYMQYKSGLKGLKYPESYPERFPESRMHNISTKISTKHFRGREVQRNVNNSTRSSCLWTSFSQFVVFFRTHIKQLNSIAGHCWSAGCPARS